MTIFSMFPSLVVPSAINGEHSTSILLGTNRSGDSGFPRTQIEFNAYHSISENCLTNFLHKIRTCKLLPVVVWPTRVILTHDPIVHSGGYPFDSKLNLFLITERRIKFNFIWLSLGVTWFVVLLHCILQFIISSRAIVALCRYDLCNFREQPWFQQEKVQPINLENSLAVKCMKRYQSLCAKSVHFQAHAPLSMFPEALHPIM